MFGVCCNNTVPDVLPEEPKNEQAVVDEENEAIVDDLEDFPIDGQVRRTCGFRSINDNLLVRPAPLPAVTLYNQSPNPALNLYRALLPTNYIVNGQEAVSHEFPWMVGGYFHSGTFSHFAYLQAALMNLQRQFCGGSLIDENHILTAAHCVAQ